LAVPYSIDGSEFQRLTAVLPLSTENRGYGFKLSKLEDYCSVCSGEGLIAVELQCEHPVARVIAPELWVSGPLTLIIGGSVQLF
jgi:hypothetical protein